MTISSNNKVINNNRNKFKLNISERICIYLNNFRGPHMQLSVCPGRCLERIVNPSHIIFMALLPLYTSHCRCPHVIVIVIYTHSASRSFISCFLHVFFMYTKIIQFLELSRNWDLRKAINKWRPYRVKWLRQSHNRRVFIPRYITPVTLDT